MMKIEKLVYLPQLLKNKVALYFAKKRLRAVGVNCRIQCAFYMEGEEFITIGNNFTGGERIRLCAWKTPKDKNTQSKIEIGDNVCITEGCYLSAAKQIIIESGVLLGINTFITDNFHGRSTYEEMQISPLDREIYAKGPVIIEKNVWVGRNVSIMPGVTIGEGAVIGANSVVTHDIPKYSIAAGIPARVIKINNDPQNSD